MAVVSANRSYSFGKHSWECGRRGKNNPQRRMRNNFLTKKIACIPGYELACNNAIACNEPDKCIDHLVRSIHLFYTKFGIKSELPEITGNFQYDVKQLYIHLCNHLPNKDWKVECVKDKEDNQSLRFVVYKELDDFPLYTIWTIPISKLETCEPQIRELLLYTFAMLHHEDMFLYPKESYDMQCVLGQVECNSWGKDKLEVDIDALDQWEESFKEWAARYVIGDIYKMFEEIRAKEKSEDRPLSDKVLELVKSLKVENRYDYGLLSAIEDAANICKEAWLTEYHISMIKDRYGNDFATEERDNGVMDFCRLFLFCYQIEDPMVEYMIDLFNQCGFDMEIGSMLVCSEIDDENIESKMNSDYPSRWQEIMEGLIDKLK